MPSTHPSTRPVCLYQQFRQHADRHPAHTAVIGPRGAISYAELDNYALRLASGLSERGITRGTTVAMLLDRGVDAIGAQLACLRLGAVIVALDTQFPAARLATILQDCEPDLVLADDGYRHLSTGHGAPTVTCDTITADQHTMSSPAVVADGHEPMYVIYTSGTTGRPKGIIQTYRTIRNLIDWQNNATSIRFTGRVLHNSSLAFDVSLQEIYSTLTRGGTLIVSSPDERTDPDMMLALLRQQQVNVLFFPVSTLTRIFASTGRLPQMPDTITDIITAGEQLYINDQLRGYLTANPEVRLHNHYGVSESHVVTAYTVTGNSPDLPAKVPIGRAIPGTRVFLRSSDGTPTPDGQPGEVVIAGQCLAVGYLNRADEQARRFIVIDGERCYLTGDQAIQHSSGDLEFLGRTDLQLKIRGFLVEPEDVEAAMLAHPAVVECVVAAEATPDGEIHLAAWYTLRGETSSDVLRAHMQTRLPAFMTPSRMHQLPAMPLTATGKIDRAAAVVSVPTGNTHLSPTAFHAHPALETQILTVIDSLTGVTVSAHTSFFDAGATSLTLVTAAHLLTEQLGIGVRTIDLLRFPTAAKLAHHLSTQTRETQPNSSNHQQPGQIRADEGVAVIGTACRLPGADNVDELWAMLIDGMHGLRQHQQRQPSWWLPTPNPQSPVPAAGLIDHAYDFDPAFFGMSAREAIWTDPQQRLLLMCAHDALEHSGVIPHAAGNVGVYVGGEFPGYMANVRPHIQSMADYLQALIGNDKDFLATRIAYKLDLTGPAVTVQTACSTSLVAVHMARRALLSGDCDVAIAGGVSLQMPQEYGHTYEPGLIYSRDGMTRPFDRDGDGTNITSGVGIVVLKRLSEAIADRDNILAVIRGSAINNDGADKAGFTAPSFNGQATVIRAALRDAGVHPDQITFVEGHGTATPLGDAVEVAALADVFGTDRQVPLYLGSIKGNIGHTNRAAGVAALIKTVLAMQHGQIPATAGHTVAADSLQGTVFSVPITPIAMPIADGPHLAGISSFGFGGTNAHVVVEQWRRVPAPVTPRPQVVLLSTETETQLAQLAADLATHLRRHPDVTVTETAFTYNTGRRLRRHIASVVAENTDQLVEGLAGVQASRSVPEPPRLVFLMPGGGRSSMPSGAQLYHRYQVFRNAVDEMLQALTPSNAGTLRQWLASQSEADDTMVGRAELMQPLMFGLCRATALLLMDWGVKPDVIVGSSQGEYFAVCVAGGASVEDMSRLLEERGRLEDTLAPDGAMLSAELTWDAAERYQDDCLLAARNSRGHVLFAGTAAAVEKLEDRLTRDDINVKRLANHKANHTPRMQPAAQALGTVLRFVRWQQTGIPVVSTVNGQILELHQLADPRHWMRHACQPIELAAAMDTAITTAPTIVLEIGPSAGLCGLAQYHFADSAEVTCLTTLPRGGQQDEERLLHTIAELVRLGVKIDPYRLHADDIVAKVALPAHPYNLSPFRLPTPESMSHNGTGSPAIQPRSRWAYTMSWCPAPLPATVTRRTAAAWLVVCPRGSQLPSMLRSAIGDHSVVNATPDPASINEACRRLRKNNHDTVFAVIHTHDQRSHEDSGGADKAIDDMAQLVATYQCITRELTDTDVTLVLVTQGSYDADPNHDLGPSPFTTAAIIMAQEQTRLRTVHIDFADSEIDAQRIVEEANVHTSEPVVVYRNSVRQIAHYRQIAIDMPQPPLRQSGATWLISGGLGQVGMQLSRHLAGQGANLLIVGRRPGTDVSVQTGMKELLQLGIRVGYQQADVTVHSELAEAVTCGEAALGPITAVIHAAAAIDGDRFLQFLHVANEQDLRSQIAVKVQGMQNLDRIFAARNLDVRCAFSSNSVWLGGLGYGPYALANAMMATHVTPELPHGQRWSIIDWDVWAATTTTETPGQLSFGTSQAAQPMPTADALCLLDSLTATQPTRTLISTTTLTDRIHLIADLLHGAVPADRPNDPQPTSHPSTPREIAAAAWHSALHATVTDDCHFVELGGDSLTAIRVVLEINRKSGSTLTAQDMLQSTTFAAFVGRLELNLSSRLSPRAEVSVDPRQTPGLVAVSSLQQRWYEMDQRGFGHLTIDVQVHGELKPDLAQTALEHLCSRHDVLHSRYEASTVLRQRLLHGWHPTLRFTDLSALPPAEQTKALQGARQHTHHRFDLLREVPFDLELLRLSAHRSQLIGRMHHIAMDGWSFSLLLEDFDRLYDLLDHDGDPASLPLPPQYHEFVDRHLNYLASEEFLSTRQFWQTQFSGARGPTCLPANAAASLPDGADPEAGACVHAVLEAASANQVRAAAGARHTTLFTMLVSAFSLMLRHATGQDDLIFGTTSAGRHLVHTDDTLGVFVNPLPLRVKLGPSRGTDDVVAAVSQSLMDFHQHQNYLLADLIQHVEPFVERDINETFHAYILLQNYPRPQVDGPRQYDITEADDLSETPAQARHTASKLMRDLELVIVEQPDGSLSLNFWYRQGRLADSQIRDWAAEFLAAVHKLGQR